MCSKSVYKKSENKKSTIVETCIYLKETVTHQIVKCKLFLSTAYHMDGRFGAQASEY